MFAWFFGLGQMTRVVTYIGAILGAIYAALQIYMTIRPLISG